MLKNVPSLFNEGKRWKINPFGEEKRVENII